MQEPYATAQAATTLSILTVLSPVAGLGVEMTLAWRFGASETVDAFRIASLLLIFGSQLSFGQLIPHVVIPLFAEYRATGQEQEGWKFVCALSGILGIVALVFVVWVWRDGDTLVDLLGPGLGKMARTETLSLLRYCSLAFVSMAWAGIMSSVLHAYQVFWILPTAQMGANVLIVACLLSLGGHWGSEVLGFGIVAGAVFTVGLHLYILRRLFMRAGPPMQGWLKRFPWPTLRKAARLSMPLLATLFLMQWTGVVINRTLSTLPVGSLANFGYAWKLLSLVSILPASLATVIFPALSEAQAGDHPAELRRLVMKAVRLTLVLSAPLAVSLLVVRTPVLHLLFARGAMNHTALAETSALFAALLVGTPLSALLTILFKMSYALQDTQSPTVAILVSALVLTWLIPYAAATAGAAGLAWAFTINTWIITLGLLLYLDRRYKIVSGWELMRYCSRLGVVCLGLAVWTSMFAVCLAVNAAVWNSLLLLKLGLIACASLGVGYGLCLVCGINESVEIWRYCQWRLRQLVGVKSGVLSG